MFVREFQNKTHRNLAKRILRNISEEIFEELSEALEELLEESLEEFLKKSLEGLKNNLFAGFPIELLEKLSHGFTPNSFHSSISFC